MSCRTRYWSKWMRMIRTKVFRMNFLTKTEYFPSGSDDHASDVTYNIDLIISCCLEPQLTYTVPYCTQSSLLQYSVWMPYENITCHSEFFYFCNFWSFFLTDFNYILLLYFNVFTLLVFFSVAYVSDQFRNGFKNKIPCSSETCGKRFDIFVN